MASNERIIRDFLKAWSRLDAAGLVGYFAADGTCHNMPSGPVTGLLNMVSQADVVIAERLDTYTRALQR